VHVEGPVACVGDAHVAELREGIVWRTGEWRIEGEHQGGEHDWQQPREHAQNTDIASADHIRTYPTEPMAAEHGRLWRGCLSITCTRCDSCRSR